MATFIDINFDGFRAPIARSKTQDCGCNGSRDGLTLLRDYGVKGMKHGVRKQKNWAAGPAHAQIGRPSDYDQYDIPTLQHRISEGHRAATHYETLAKDPSTHPDTKKMLTAAAKKTREQNEMFKERLRRKQAQA